MSCAASGLRGGVTASLLRVWISETRGRVLLAGWIVTFVGITGRAVYLRRRLNQPRSPKLPDPVVETSEKALEAKKAKTPGPLRSVMRLALPSYRSKTTAWFAIFSLGLGVRLAVSVKISSEVGVLGALLAKREWTQLFKRQLTYALWAVPAAATSALQKYSRDNAALCLRNELMHHVHDGLTAAAGEAAHSPSSDQPLRSLPLALSAASANGPDGPRAGSVNICIADTRAFCTSAVELYEAVTKPLIEVSLLSLKLAMMMGPAQLFRCYAFFAAAGCWTRFAGPSIATMTTVVAEAEADLLAQHAHLAEYSEEVAMIGGGEQEAATMHAAMTNLSKSTATLHFQRFGSDTLDGYVLRHLGILSAFTAMLPAVVGAAPSTGLDPTEYFLTSLHLLVNVGMACKDLVLAHKTAATASAHAKRVQTLLSMLHGQQIAPGTISTHQAVAQYPRLVRSLGESNTAVLQLANVLIAPPGTDAIVAPITFAMPRAGRVLASGPNGCGKSSLLRVILGVWPNRSGEILTPPIKDIFVLPQRPYILATGSIEAQLLYPGTPGIESRWTDTNLLEALQWAGLGHLACNALELRVRRTDLASTLSGGERQRLAIARLYLACSGCGRKRPPSLVILDEATSACEPSFEAKLFEFIKLQGLSTLVVAHNMELRQYHTHELIFDSKGVTMQQL